MSYIPITPFRRAVDATVLEHIRTADAPLPAQSVNKWEILRELGVARAAFDLSDRQLTVLQALLSFHPEQELTPDGKSLIVFPSNASICARLNGMPCSTMRRHLARLVEAGMIQRRDSPNGKRYTKRGHAGVQAFGFDLSPLLRRYDEIFAKAEDIRQETERTRQAKQAASLMCRDLAALSSYGKKTYPDDPVWDQLSDHALLMARHLRRKLTPEELAHSQTELEDALIKAKSALAINPTQMSTSDVQNEQHHQSSKKERDNKKKGASETRSDHVKIKSLSKINIPLSLVLENCGETQNFSPDPIKDWASLLDAMNTIRPMMGISTSVWQSAIETMGHQVATTVLAAMLERFQELRSPNAYLRYLTAKAKSGTFSCIPMLVALGNRQAV